VFDVASNCNRIAPTQQFLFSLTLCSSVLKIHYLPVILFLNILWVMEDNKQNFGTISWTFVYSRGWRLRNIRPYVSVPKRLRSLVRSFSTLSYTMWDVVFNVRFTVYEMHGKSVNQHGNAPCIYALQAYIYGPLCSPVDWFGRVKTNAHRSTPASHSATRGRNTHSSPKIISVQLEGTEVCPSSVL